MNLDGAVSFVIKTTKGDYLISQNKKILRLNFDTKETTQVLEVDEQHPQNRFNDAKCDSKGRLWAGTMGYEPEPSKVEEEKGSLYSIDGDFTVKSHLDKLNISNGLAWSRDDQIMYFVDSHPRKVYAFDFDFRAGTLSNQRVAIDFGNEKTLPMLGNPDGIAMDVHGKLWIACFGAGKVARFDPVTGKQIQGVYFPNASRITSCCFGGPNYSELYVTSCRSGLTEEQLKTTDSLAGSVFKVSGLRIKGVPNTLFEG